MALSGDALTWLIPSSVLIAGLIGSPHCVAMCGPLVMAFGRERKSLASYHAGRGLTYTSAGALAGLLGREAFHSPRPMLSIVSLLALTLLLTTFALRSNENPHHTGSTFISRIHKRAWATVKALGLPAPALSFSAGALTIFLPCFHLYGFMAGAAATGSAAAGAIFMFTFWLSTIPALSAAPVLLKRFFGATSTQASKRWATGFLLLAAVISLGLFASRIEMANASAAETHACHMHMESSTHHHH